MDRDRDPDPEAYDAVLRWCRKPPVGCGARTPAMRTVDGDTLCAVIDVAVSEPRPGGAGIYDRRDRRIATGGTWREVLAALPTGHSQPARAFGR